jgi:hypothetical protein
MKTLIHTTSKDNAMKFICFLTLTLALVSNSSFANHHEGGEAEMTMPSFSASRAVTADAQVIAIDYETRIVTLRGDDGIQKTFTADADVVNLPQVKVGDHVIAEFYEKISLSVHKPNSVMLGSVLASDVAVVKEGEKPAGGLMSTFVTTQTVEEINLDNNTFKLKDVEGTVTEFTARDPDNLRRSEVGDIVVIKIVQAIGIPVGLDIKTLEQ